MCFQLRPVFHEMKEREKSCVKVSVLGLLLPTTTYLVASQIGSNSEKIKRRKHFVVTSHNLSLSITHSTSLTRPCSITQPHTQAHLSL